MVLKLLFVAGVMFVLSVTRWGGPDAGFLLPSHPVQFEYVRCLADPDAIWFEDGSAWCWR